MDKRPPPQTDEAFAALYARNVKRIYRICYLHLRSVQDAEDAVQTVFLKYWKADKVFRDEEHEKAWFIVAAQNHCRDVCRLFCRRFRLVDPAAIPERSAEDADYTELTEALLGLPRLYKDVLYLHYYEGYTTKEIAAMLKRNESTVRTQLSKGRERLKAKLEEENAYDGRILKGSL